MPSPIRPTLVALFLCLAARALPAQQADVARAVDAARRGGVVIACRHGITGSQDEDEATLRYDDPSTQRRLSEAGEQQARDVGAALRALRIPIADVIASPMQRTRLTAELMFGQATLDSAWHTRGENYSGWKRERRLAHLGTPVDGGNRVIVSHIGTMYSVLPSLQGELEEGDCAVIRPRGDASFEVVGVVPWRAWLRAARDSSPPSER